MRALSVRRSEAVWAKGRIETSERGRGVSIEKTTERVRAP
jgi:hypothetical protein